MESKLTPAQRTRLAQVIENEKAMRQPVDLNMLRSHKRRVILVRRAMGWKGRKDQYFELCKGMLAEYARPSSFRGD